MIKRFAPLAVIILALISLWFFGFFDYLATQDIASLKATVTGYAENNFYLTLFGFGLVYILTVVLSLPIASLMTLVGGAVFGTLAGTLIVVSAATIGATLLFLIARTALGDILKTKVSGFYNKVEKEMTENAWFYLFSVRLTPIFPFFVMNILPALFPTIKTWQFASATFLGIIPGTFVYVNLGATVSDISSVSDLISKDIILAFCLLGALSLLPVVIKKLKGKKK